MKKPHRQYRGSGKVKKGLILTVGKLERIDFSFKIVANLITYIFLITWFYFESELKLIKRTQTLSSFDRHPQFFSKLVKNHYNANS